MRQAHFEALRPVCPACRSRGALQPLALRPGAREARTGILSGLLGCAGCGTQYPILDGAPILVPDLPAWLSANGHLLLQRFDLPGDVQDVLGRALGADAAFNLVRQQQSSYAFDHYGDLGVGAVAPSPASAGAMGPGSVRRALRAALDSLLPLSGPVLDIGCAAGRTSFDLAERTVDLVLGIDVNWPLLAVARGVVNEGVARFPMRRMGLDYELRADRTQFPCAERVDFWMCDALALPFAPQIFAGAVAMNVLDCVSEPARLLYEIGRALHVGGGQAVLATPFDWAAHATPMTAWIGGPEEFAALCGSVNEALRRDGLEPLVIVRTAETEWQVRLHDRATMVYRVFFASVTNSPGV
jgi:SAM-dependent methyltransferase/uncharacterized protein YbaR (Trm112 family)